MPRDLGGFEARFNSPTQGRFFFPQRLLWGENNLNDIISLVDCPLEIFIDRAIQKNDYVEKLINQLSDQAVRTIHIVDRPYYEEIEEYVRLNPESPATVVSIGGGSTFDFAKAAVALRSFGELDNLGIGNQAGKQTLRQQLPVLICLPTTCGSGAESSRYVVTYRKDTGKKIHGKSWQLSADWVFIEPQLLSHLPLDVIISSAFDAFVHFFETLSMKHETTPLSTMLSTYGMFSIITNIDQLLANENNEIPHNLLLELMICGSLGGVAISNTRTGHIHEAAGALVEEIEMSHGYSLWVFFQYLARDVFEATSDRFELLIQILQTVPLSTPIAKFEDILSWWQSVFILTHFQKFRETDWTSKTITLENLVQAVLGRIESDRVWMEKEAPYKPRLEQLERDVRNALVINLGLAV
jgi:alcohol dehydrogenase class IV